MFQLTLSLFLQGATVQKSGICKTLPKRSDVDKDATEVVTEYVSYIF